MGLFVVTFGTPQSVWRKGGRIYFSDLGNEFWLGALRQAQDLRLDNLTVFQIAKKGLPLTLDNL